MRTRIRLCLLALSALLMLACGGESPGGSTSPTTAGSTSPTTPARPLHDAGFARAAGGELTVYAAASLTQAFEEIATGFEADNPGTTVVYNFAGSQQLAQQIVQGAPADVFASANDKQMGVARDGGKIEPDADREFVRNRLVVVVPKSNPAGLKELKDLAKPGIKLVLAAPEVPAGQYSVAMLDAAAGDPTYGADWKKRVTANVESYEENVRAVLSKASLGEADAGVVYESDAAGAKGVGRIVIPESLNQVASYPIAPVSGSERAEAARRFVEYVLSEKGQATLEQYGFIPVGR
ncbi:MAG: molybdate ABC transporter substrate-binding protein [Chloroflexia bacterium]